MNQLLVRKIIPLVLLAFVLVEGKCEDAAGDGDCNSIANPQLRLACFDSSSRGKAERRADKSDVETRKKFESALRAASKIIGATEAGVTYIRFSELLGDFAGEVSFLESDATTDLEKEGVKILRRSVEIYRDSASVWSDTIASNSNPSMQLQQDFIIFSFYPKTAVIVNKYDLPWSRDTSFLSGPDSVYGPGVRVALWERAELLIRNMKRALQDFR